VDPLAAGEEGVAHGLVDLVWVLQRNGCVHCVGLGEHSSLEVEVERIFKFNFLGCHCVFLSFGFLSIDVGRGHVPRFTELVFGVRYGVWVLMF